MGKPSALQSAIQNLDIKAPFQFRNTQKESAQTEAPQIERAKSEAVNGFFMMAHRIFSEASLRALPGDCFRVFLWMSAQAYRFPGSSGTIRASAKFVSAGVGVSESSVVRAFDTLLKAKLIKRQEINFKLGNMWWVSPIAFAGDTDPSGGGKKPQTEVPRSEGAQSEGEGHRNSASSSPNPGQQLTQIGGQIKNIQDSKIKDSLSPESEVIAEYFRELKPERKKGSEWEAYQSLARGYPDEDIEKGLNALWKEDPKRSKYHSPMAYLAVSMEQILAKHGKAERSAEISGQTANEETEQAKALEEWRAIEAAFVAAFPTEEDCRLALDQYAPGLTVGGEKTRRGIAVSRWWEGRKFKTETA